MPSDLSKFSVLLVDDEKEASANLKAILQDYIDPEINIAGIASNTMQAEELINRLSPDAIFLDIEMPNENAFHFLERIGPVSFEVVFVTAYDEYAIKAFKLNAVDYILKPISISELTSAYGKLQERVKYKRMLAESRVPYSDLSNQVINKVKQHRITLKDNNQIEVVDFKDIYFLEAQGSYSRIVFLKESAVKEIVMANSIADYEDLLPSELFFRIHKSYLINCGQIRKILKDETNQVVINGKYTLPISRRRFVPLIDFLKTNGFPEHK